MKDLMMNLRSKPRILFMLVVICLAPPLRIIHTAKACTDCSDEIALVAALEDEVELYKKMLAVALHDKSLALKRVLKAVGVYQAAKKAVEAANRQVQKAGAALLAAMALVKKAAASKNPWAMLAAAAAVTLALLFANDARKAFKQANTDLKNAHKAWTDANTAYEELKAIVKDLEDDLKEAEDDLAAAKILLALCQAGQ